MEKNLPPGKKGRSYKTNSDRARGKMALDAFYGAKLLPKRPKEKKRRQPSARRPII